MRVYRDIVKRPLDLCAAGMLTVCLSPLILFLVITLHFANKGAGVIFTQDRAGKGGKLFKIYKFKSMTDERDAEGNLLPDEQRITRIGKFLRYTSLDELPQLINIFKGEVSMIGPRAMLATFLPLYSPEQRRRLEVLPGVTGWAQVHGRNNSSYQDRFEFDVWYVDNVSFLVDLKILWKTAIVVIKHEGTSEESGPELFNGHN